MSRSRQKFPRTYGTGHQSNRGFKLWSHKQFRLAEKAALRRGHEPPLKMYEISEIWCSSQEWPLMVDPRKEPEAMRK